MGGVSVLRRLITGGKDYIITAFARRKADHWVQCVQRWTSLRRPLPVCCTVGAQREKPEYAQYVELPGC